MTLYGEVVKLLNHYWITPDQPEHPSNAKYVARNFSVLTDPPKK